MPALLSEFHRSGKYCVEANSAHPDSAAAEWLPAFASALLEPTGCFRYVGDGSNNAVPGFSLEECLATRQRPFFGSPRPGWVVVDIDGVVGALPRVQALLVALGIEDWFTCESGSRAGRYHVWAFVPRRLELARLDVECKSLGVDLRWKARQNVRPPCGLHRDEVSRSVVVDMSEEEALDVIERTSEADVEWRRQAGSKPAAISGAVAQLLERLPERARRIAQGEEIADLRRKSDGSIDNSARSFSTTMSCMQAGFSFEERFALYVALGDRWVDKQQRPAELVLSEEWDKAKRRATQDWQHEAEQRLRAAAALGLKPGVLVTYEASVRKAVSLKRLTSVGLSGRQLAEMTGRGRATVERHLKVLVKAGLLEVARPGRGLKGTEYHLPLARTEPLVHRGYVRSGPLLANLPSTSHPAFMAGGLPAAVHVTLRGFVGPPRSRQGAFEALVAVPQRPAWSTFKGHVRRAVDEGILVEAPEGLFLNSDFDWEAFAERLGTAGRRARIGERHRREQIQRLDALLRQMWNDAGRPDDPPLRAVSATRAVDADGIAYGAREASLELERRCHAETEDNPFSLVTCLEVAPAADAVPAEDPGSAFVDVDPIDERRCA